MALLCQYVDHTTHSLRFLGKLHSQHCQEKSGSKADGFTLSTCHRHEYYTHNQHSRLGVPNFIQVSSPELILYRLSSIAAGVNSVIPGDRMVLGQVGGACRTAPQDMSQLVGNALAIAKGAREKYGLYPTVDYVDLLKEIDSLSGRLSAPPKQLIIVGGGSLTRGLIAEAGNQYSLITVMTRHASRFRNAMEINAHEQVNVQTCRVRSGALNINLNASFDLVVAATQFSREYAALINQLWSHTSVRRVLDYSSSPLPPPNSSVMYSHISDNHVLRYLATSNRSVKHRVNFARPWIKNQARRLARSVVDL